MLHTSNLTLGTTRYLVPTSDTNGKGFLPQVSYDSFALGTFVGTEVLLNVKENLKFVEYLVSSRW